MTASPRIVVIDNYDSFTYNLVQYLGELGAETLVFRNDAIEPAAIDQESTDGLLISPGPGNPDGAGISTAVIERFAGLRPVLGVCLGHQCVAQLYGARIVRADRIMHGKTSNVVHDGKGIFRELPNPFTATRYHSLLVAPESLPPVLEMTARTAENEIMAVKHRQQQIWGVQFHPESILTEHGHALLDNFLTYCRAAGSYA